MKDGEILAIMTNKWQSANKLKEKLNGHWNKILSQLSNLEHRGVIEKLEIPRKKYVYRFYRLPTPDEQISRVIDNTEVKYRSDKDHKYQILHKYKNSVRNYINAILEGKENPNETIR